MGRKVMFLNRIDALCPCLIAHLYLREMATVACLKTHHAFAWFAHFLRLAGV